MKEIKRKIGVVGLGASGLCLALAFSGEFTVTGYDNCIIHIQVLREKYRESGIKFTDQMQFINDCDLIIISRSFEDDLENVEILLKKSSEVGKNVRKGTAVVYEFSVYPGLIEKRCIPILEEYSNLKFGIDCFVGYSPEKSNIHDRLKVISGTNGFSLDLIANYYQKVADEVVCISSIKAAETSKIFKNMHPELYIAMLLELEILFKRLEKNLL